uniref:Uncharacterized protein n=1 Tax=Sus scrofa TaxID=9823 RepID=A0A4X1SK50_PIG
MASACPSSPGSLSPGEPTGACSSHFTGEDPRPDDCPGPAPSLTAVLSSLESLAPSVEPRDVWPRGGEGSPVPGGSAVLTASLGVGLCGIQRSRGGDWIPRDTGPPSVC